MVSFKLYFDASKLFYNLDMKKKHLIAACVDGHRKNSGKHLGLITESSKGNIHATNNAHILYCLSFGSTIMLY